MPRRARAQNSIWVDGMDQLQGSLFCTNYKGKLAAELMNKQRYDGMSLSNHEFDNAPERPCCADPRLTVRMRLSWMRYKFNDARRHKFEKKRYRISNWAVYNESLRQRADMTFWLRFAGGGLVARKAPQDKGWSADLL